MNKLLSELTKNGERTVIIALLFLIPPCLYYFTGQLGFLVKPIETLLGGMYQLVFIAFAIIGIIVSYFMRKR
jgi:membrane protein implicated in regulation of membrane protease activity